MAFPSTISTFTNPQANDRLNNPSHSSIESAQNTALLEIENYLGTTATSALGTLIGDLKNPLSDGGGHVQGVNKGGTGQTAYTKGDLLIASSSSVLAKLGLGVSGQVLTADNTQTSGVKWDNLTKLQIVTNVSVLGLTEISVLSVAIPASVIGSVSGIKATLNVSNYIVGGAAEALTLKAIYGNNTLGTVTLTPSGASSASVKGTMQYFIVSAGTESAQRGNLSLNWKADRLNVLQTSVLGVEANKFGTSSVNSMQVQTWGITAQFAGSTAGTLLQIDNLEVEKIV